MNRRKAVENAMSSMELSGFVFDEEEKEILERIAKEELPISALYDLADARLAKLRKERPEIFVTEDK